mmetsp:Transcript_11809/g.21515  ORF Transcript_11809/g.21515 Transcript_11809/m.21515 type:complete len:432 (-) Transcript_11809:70-1365(-)
MLAWHLCIWGVLALGGLFPASARSFDTEGECAISAEHPCLHSCYPDLLQLEFLAIRQKHRDPLRLGTYQKSLERCACDMEELYVQDFLSACQPIAPGAVRVFAPANHSCFRIPAIAKTAKGTLLAFAEVRHGSCKDGKKVELAVSRSTDNGQTWSDAKFIVGSLEHPASNPWPIAMKSGAVMMHYAVDLAFGTTQVVSNYVIFSTDDGLSWGTPLNISSQVPPNHPGPNGGLELQLPSGGKRLLVAAWQQTPVSTLVYYSDDAGLSWQVVPEERGNFPGVVEPGVADLGNGELLMQMRYKHEISRGKAMSRSMDYGLTWSEVFYAHELIGPFCQASITAINGSVYFSNTANHKKRANMSIHRSDDGGHSWPMSMVVQPRSSKGYSSLVHGAVGAGHGGLLFESLVIGAIDFFRFPLSLSTEQTTVNRDMVV